MNFNLTDDQYDFKQLAKIFADDNFAPNANEWDQKENFPIDVMVVPLGNQLAKWRSEVNVNAVLIKGAGEKAFCAGGDIVNICDLVKTNKAKASLFFWSEYRTNWGIKNFPKPYIAIMDGFVMGGGVGIFVHGFFRIVTEKTVLAMPETIVGFYPDVGASYFLPKLQGNMGLYLGLTGHRLKAADLIELNIATHYISSKDLPELEATLTDADFNDDAFAVTEKILSQFCTEPPSKSSLMEIAVQINQSFNEENLIQIYENLRTNDTDFNQRTLKILNKMSPISLSVTFEQLRRSKDFCFDAALQQEMRITSQMLEKPDFHEGVRALLVDRDKNPSWQIKSLENVPSAMVDEFFEPISNELFFDWDKPIDFVKQ
ncbi:MAG: enoyl-CoA hydratase/isomerase family protein [Rhizobiales bacterium]|nr:enoyl-CoA hydratase/isomerase family protein [Hyphomicrobiales bacterium]